MRIVARLIGPVSVVTLAACVFDPSGTAPPGPGPQKPEQTVELDRARIDGPAVDLKPGEKPAVREKGGDRPTAMDRTPLDRPLDKSPVPPDQPSIKPDLTGPPCATGMQAFTFAADMVVCTTSSAVLQCDAANHCGAGWHLCTASEYLARGGKTKQPPGDAWLASCIRSQGAPYAPTDQICGSCAHEDRPTVDLAWACYSKDTFDSSHAWVGVSAWIFCRRVGVDQASTEAYWARSVTYYNKYDMVVCCK